MAAGNALLLEERCGEREEEVRTRGMRRRGVVRGRRRRRQELGAGEGGGEVW